MESRPRVVLYNPRAVFYTMPLALLAIGSAIDRRRFDVRIVDGRLEPDPVRAVLTAADGALCVGVTVLTGAPIRDALAVSRAVKKRFPRLPVIWGGWHPSLFPEECEAEPCVDRAVVGQGELAFRSIVEELSDRGAVAAARPPAAALHDLNDLPPHDYTLIDVERYFALKGRRQIDYISSQGCRFRCAFCADPTVYARGWTGLAPDRVAAEAVALKQRYGMEELAFQDETFFTHPARVDALADRFLSHGLACAWTATLRADQACRMGEALLAKAVQSGLRRVMIGVESGSQAMLDAMKKDLRLDQVMIAAEMCRRHDLGAIFNFIVGFPGESDASIEETLQLAKRLRRMSPAFETPIFSYRPYPGNPIADEARRRGYDFPRNVEAWADFDYVGARGPWVSADRWERVERFAFYARHAWKPGAWRWPLRAAARWRCEHDWYAAPVEKVIAEWIRPPQQVS
jgi:radical SAM superfamily enzyme YgiQ (UPF0313 family)